MFDSRSDLLAGNKPSLCRLVPDFTLLLSGFCRAAARRCAPNGSGKSSVGDEHFARALDGATAA